MMFKFIVTIVPLITVVITILKFAKEKRPIKIDIKNNKYKCFFGNVLAIHEDGKECYEEGRISGVKFAVRNSSNADIEISEIILKIKNEYYRMISPSHPYWCDVHFLTLSNETGQMEIDAFNICYRINGCDVPFSLKKYTTKQTVALFYNFPSTIKEKTKAQLIIKTACGNFKKRITMFEYNNTFEKEEYEEVKQYYNSIKRHSC